MKPVTTMLMTAVIVCAVSQNVFAGSCISTSRDLGLTGDASARTTVRNQTSTGDLFVVITRNGTEKLNTRAVPGAEVTFKAGLGGDNLGPAKFVVALKTANAKDACSYTVKNVKNSSLDWYLDSGQTAVCSASKTFDIGCQKTYQKNRLQYHTVFTVKDAS